MLTSCLEMLLALSLPRCESSVRSMLLLGCVAQVLVYVGSQGMEAVAQQRPDAASDRTSTTGAGTASDRLRVHAHLYKPRLKTSSAAPDFQAELRQYASRQGRDAAIAYATALGVSSAVELRSSSGVHAIAVP